MFTAIFTSFTKLASIFKGVSNPVRELFAAKAPVRIEAEPEKIREANTIE